MREEDVRELLRETQAQLIKVFVIAMVAMAAVCIVACVSMAYQVTEISSDYFDYEYTPASITNTQTNNN